MNTEMKRAIDACGTAARLAAAIGKSAQFITQLCKSPDEKGWRPMPPAIAVKIERASRGAARCERLCPEKRWVRVTHDEWPQGMPLLDLSEDVQPVERRTEVRRAEDRSEPPRRSDAERRSSKRRAADKAPTPDAPEAP